MCREALKGYLGSQAPQLDEEALRLLVDEDDASLIPRVAAPAIGAALERVTVVDPACGSGAYLVGMMQELLELYGALYSEQLLDDARSLYQLKLHIIERNLHGVDLDPFAVNIAMLRLWLSLAIEYEGAQPEPLPNLDFKIVEGDSLLGPDPSQLNLDSHAIRESNLGALKGEYLRAQSGAEKDRLRGEIESAEEQVRSLLADATLPEGAVDWRIDFAEVVAEGGFDIAIANPPYIQLQRDDGHLKHRYEPVDYQTLTGNGDIYQLFYERGCQLLTAGGTLAYITSNSWQRAKYGNLLREFLHRHTKPLRLVDLGNETFDSAIVDSSVLILQTGETGSAFPAIDLDDVSGDRIPEHGVSWGQVTPNGQDVWVILPALEASAMTKMLHLGTRLGDWPDVDIFMGVMTGYNRAFVVDKAERDRLVAENARSREVLRPTVRGRNIQRYRADWPEEYLIFIPWHFPLHGHADITSPSREAEMAFKRDFPAIHRFLLQHKDALAKRKQTGQPRYEWFALKQYLASNVEALEAEKLVWIDLTEQGRFALDRDGRYPLNSAYLLTGSDLRFLCGVLNGTLATWFVRRYAQTSGMGTPRWITSTVQAIPVPSGCNVVRDEITSLVDQILDAKDANPDADTSELEAEIDRLVYELYGLTEEEVAAVERRVGRSG